jgi:hypothetical protein
MRQLWKLTLDRDNKLRNNREDLGTTFLKHITDTLDGQETVGVNLFTDSFEEDRKIMMVIELRNINFPVDLILGSVLNSDWQIKMFGDGSHFARVVSSNSHAFLLGAYLKQNTVRNFERRNSKAQKV